jgi:hypothetical protein
LLFCMRHVQPSSFFLDMWDDARAAGAMPTYYWAS